jgi:hypothetical protein
MKANLRDHLGIFLALAAIFLCGFGIGQLVAKRPAAAAQPVAWEIESLSLLRDSLALSAEETSIVEREIAVTAGEIRARRNETLLDYHHHLDQLYSRLIAQLGETQAARLRAEKKHLEEAIRELGAAQTENSNPENP